MKHAKTMLTISLWSIPWSVPEYTSLNFLVINEIMQISIVAKNANMTAIKVL